MKLCLAMLAALALAGCSTLEHQQRTLDALRQDVRQLSTELIRVEKSVSALNEQVRGFEQVVDARFERIGEELSKPVEFPTPVCEFPQVAVAATSSEACEATVERVIENGTDKLVVGSVERIRITPPGIEVDARIDTGADSSSISATDLEYFERDGEDWVRFKLTVSEEEIYVLEREVLRFVRVYQQSDIEGGRRPVVRLRVEIGSIRDRFEFNLSDRRHLKHPIILGRNLLMDLVVVDVSEKKLNSLADGGR